MMLVISVIVAIAILGVLLNILGGVSFSANDPKEIMKTELKSVVSSGFGVSQPKEADFKSGAQVLRKAVIGDSPIIESELEFACGSDSKQLCSGSDAPLDVQEDNIVVNKNTRGWIVVCGDDTNKDVKYCVGIGRQAADSRKACTERCKLTK